MIQLIDKCKKCNGLMIQTNLIDKKELSYSSFEIKYCPNCIKLGEEIKVRVSAITIKQNGRNNRL